MRSRLLLSKLAALTLAAAVVLSGCAYGMPHPSLHGKMSVREGKRAPGMSKADRSAYTVGMVKQAIIRYQEAGLEATLDYYNDPGSVDGEWYVFIFDEDDLLIAHANPDLLGEDLKGGLGVDATGYRFGDLMLSATEEGLWVDYLFLNLATGNQEYKHAFVVRYDGLLFGSGWYQVLPDLSRPTVSKADRPGYAVHLVEQAIQRYEKEGRDATVAFLNSPANLDGEWYVFLIDEDDFVIGHPREELRGQYSMGDEAGELGVDVTGYNYGETMHGVTEDGLWVDYFFHNPATGDNEYKHTWAVRHDGLIFGSGWYQILPGLDLAPTKAYRPGFTVAMVEQAVQRYEAQGRDAAVAHYNTPESVDGEWYVFIIDEDDRMIAHANPDLLGEDLKGPLGVDVTGYRFGDHLLGATEDGLWVDYIFANPATGNQEYKHSYVVRRDDLLFGSGWYQVLPGVAAAPSKADRSGFTVAMVEQAIQHYETHGLDATLEFYNSPESVDGSWYVFIFDEEERLIAHPLTELLGEELTGPLGVDLTGYRHGEKIAAATEEGVWVNYYSNNPATDALEYSDSLEYKHTWAVRHDGLIFGSGWYQVLPNPLLGVTKGQPALYTIAFVEQAIRYYKAHGREAAVAHYNTPESVNGAWYIYIIDENDQIIAHADPDLLGEDLKGDLGVDSSGYRFSDLMLEANEDGRWVEYLFVNPSTGEEQTKHTWLVRHDGILIGSGWYE